MNDQTTVETTVEQREKEPEEPFTLPQDVLIELVQVLVMFKTQMEEENGKSEEDIECLCDTVALVGSTIIQNLIDEKEKIC